MCRCDSPPESTENDSPQVLGDVSSETKLRRRRGVLLAMLRAGVEERRRRAFVAELARIEALLAHGTDTSPSLLPVQEPQPHQESLDQLIVESDTCLAQPADPHPPLGDARLTAVLRDIVQESLSSALVPLLERVSWHVRAQEIVVVCTARDLASVAEHLLAPSQRALCAIGIADVGDRIKVQIGEPELVETRPAWIDVERWRQVPVWLRSSLIGSVYIDGRVYGATPTCTAHLVPYTDILRWLLDAMGTAR